MLVLRDPLTVSAIADADLRRVLEKRFTDICCGEDYDEDLHGFMIVVECGDAVDSIEIESGCPILRGSFGNTHYGDPDFAPGFEVLEEHDCFYEMVFVPSDGDFGIGIFIPKTDCVDPTLLAFCAEYATPAPEEP